MTRHSCLSSKKKAFTYRATTEHVNDPENFEEDVAPEIRQAYARTDDPLERMSRAEQVDLLLEAIGKLPEEYREALIMSEYEGLSYEEIGKVTGTSLSTIRIRICSSRSRSGRRSRHAATGAGAACGLGNGRNVIAIRNAPRPIAQEPI